MLEVVNINKYEKTLLFKPVLIRFIWFALVALNWILPLDKDFSWHFSLFRIVVTIIWTYGMLTATGHMCINTHVHENGMILYEQNTSIIIIGIGICRIIQSVFYLVFRQGVINWSIMALLIVFDVVYLLIIILDKSSYGYALEEEEKIYKF